LTSGVSEHAIVTRGRQKYLVVTPDDPGDGHAPVLLALHGMGMSASSLLRRLQLLDVTRMRLVLPDGPHRHEIRRQDQIKTGHSWYIYNGDQELFREELERSEAGLLEILAAVDRQHPVDWSRSAVLGFSQGGYLAGFLGSRHPELLAGVIIASARLKHEFLVEEITSGELPSFLFVYSPTDGAIPFDRLEVGIAKLEKTAAEIEVRHHDDGHRLSETAIAIIATWLKEKGFDDR